MAEPKLCIIATPLGNKDDVTLRAKEALTQLRVLFAEDTREFRKLLELHGIPATGKVILSYSSHNMKEATEKALKFLAEGENVGLTCDRGTPTVSDPGALLVRAAREAGFSATPVPGPSALTALYSVSGLEGGRFSFLGFLPTSPKDRRDILERVRRTGWPACIYESPRRMRETAAELKAAFPLGRLIVGREMTKLFETFESFNLAELEPELLMEKGEYAFFLDPGPAEEVVQSWQPELEARLASDKEWAKRVAERFGVPSSEVYNALQQKKRERM